MPPDPNDPDDALPRPHLSLVGLTLRLAAASAVVAGLSLHAARRAAAPALGAAEQAAADGALLARAAEAPARAPIRPEAPGAGPARLPPPAASAAAPPAPLPAAETAPARLRLAEPGLDPVRAGPGRVDPATGWREDGLARGTFEALEAPALRLTLTRGAGAGRAPGLFVLLARRAAHAEGSPLAVLRTGAYGRVETKFGPVETLEATLAGPVTRTCTGFVTRGARLRLDGWLCAPLGRPPEPRALACTLDALDLDDPADPGAGAAFRAPRAPGCTPPAAMAEAAGRTGSIAPAGLRARKIEALLRPRRQARP